MPLPKKDKFGGGVVVVSIYTVTIQLDKEYGWVN